MSQAERVVWKNGTFLAPQHFQQADRYQESQLRLLRRAGSALSWGILDVKLNRDAVMQGALRLERCQAVLPPPDGLCIDIPDADEPPPEKRFTMPPGTERLEVFLTVPGPASKGRFQETERQLTDEFDATSLRAVRVATKNLSLAISGESLQGLSTIKIAEVSRDRQGRPVLRDGFVPTCLCIAAAPALLELGRDVMVKLEAQARDVRRQLMLRKGEQFSFYQALTQRVPILRHMLFEAAEIYHPAELYGELLQLGGALLPFADQPPDAFPAYDHGDLTACFDALAIELHRLLGFSPTPENDVFPLRPLEDGPDNMLWTADIRAGKPRPGAEVYLALRGDLPVAKLIAQLPDSGKIAAMEDIDTLVALYQPGVAFRHASKLPEDLQAQPGLYFRLSTDGNHWDKVCQSGQVAVYIPSVLLERKAPRLELICLRKGGSR